MSVNYNDFRGGDLTAGRAPHPNEDIESDFRLVNRDSCMPITYGIELQFLIPVLFNEQDPHPEDPRLVPRVSKNTD